MQNVKKMYDYIKEKNWIWILFIDDDHNFTRRGGDKTI